MTNPSLETLARRIYLIRSQKVMLDSDLAGIYGVSTRTLNQAVRRNLNRFPEDFLFRLTDREAEILRSQIVISRRGWGGRRHARSLSRNTAPSWPRPFSTRLVPPT